MTVRVLNVDANKKQIALTMKTEAESAAPPRQKRGGGKVSVILVRVPSFHHIDQLNILFVRAFSRRIVIAMK